MVASMARYRTHPEHQDPSSHPLSHPLVTCPPLPSHFSGEYSWLPLWRATVPIPSIKTPPARIQKYREALTNAAAAMTVAGGGGGGGGGGGAAAITATAAGNHYGSGGYSNSNSNSNSSSGRTSGTGSGASSRVGSTTNTGPGLPTSTTPPSSGITAAMMVVQILAALSESMSLVPPASTSAPSATTTTTTSTTTGTGTGTTASNAPTFTTATATAGRGGKRVGNTNGEPTIATGNASSPLAWF